MMQAFGAVTGGGYQMMAENVMISLPQAVLMML